jgi:hypothetical protein
VVINNPRNWMSDEDGIVIPLVDMAGTKEGEK